MKMLKTAIKAAKLAGRIIENNFGKIKEINTKNDDNEFFTNIDIECEKIIIDTIKKKFPDKIVIAGGMHTYDAIDEVAEQGFDVTFSGESEVSLLKFSSG